MLKLNLEREYKAAIYLRLSKDDGDFSVSGEKLESDSISNQRLLIKNFLKKHPEIVSTKEFCDDGYTGTNFDRPHFQEMMTAISSGELDCIVVKDLHVSDVNILSRELYRKDIPRLGIRFIAINDSRQCLAQICGNVIFCRIKNLINDSYCRDISIKVRSNLDAMRRKRSVSSEQGYIRLSPFAGGPKNKLVVDVNVESVFRTSYAGKGGDSVLHRS
jgi:DNA invertase Pin-like site-specific DNA recombinase